MIQIDIKMPSSCRECPFRDDKHCILFSYGCPDRYNVDEDYTKRPWWCELKEGDRMTYEELKEEASR